PYHPARNILMGSLCLFRSFLLPHGYALSSFLFYLFSIRLSIGRSVLLRQLFETLKVLTLRPNLSFEIPIRSWGSRSIHLEYSDGYLNSLPRLPVMARRK